MGVLLSANLVLASSVIGVWCLALVGARYVSVASLAGAGMIPVTQWLLRRPLEEIVIGVILAGLIGWQHRANLQRLRRGTEPRISLKVKQDA